LIAGSAVRMPAEYFPASPLAVQNADMPLSEEELVARIKECAHDPKRRTGMIRKFPKLAGVTPSRNQRPEKLWKRPKHACGFPASGQGLWTEVANGGFGPAYGLFGVDNEPASQPWSPSPSGEKRRSGGARVTIFLTGPRR
jgi:hypothetical protein